MKSFISLLAIGTLFSSVTEIQASNITLDGSGYYLFDGRSRYFGGSGPEQEGRKRYLGKGFYHRTEIGMGLITNRSNNVSSGDLSFEFWAMPFFGAENGIVLMTEDVGPISGSNSFSDVVRTGDAVHLQRRRFPELNIWEFTSTGWEFKDVLQFRGSRNL